MEKTKDKNAGNTSMMTPISIVVAGVLIAIAVLFSNGSIKLGKNTGSPSAPTEAVPVAPTEPPAPSVVKVSIDDDAVLGDKNAPVTVIEFSDYECPFCKRAFEQTFPILKKDYIDTGKVKYVFRDLALSFHDPEATRDAIAANCARDQKGDEGYFVFHDEIYTRTEGNKLNMTRDLLVTIASEVGLNRSEFETCLDSEKFADEVKKDLADATAVGATGTPTFFIGRSTNSGEIEGTKIVGAQPISVFTAIIDPLLAE